MVLSQEEVRALVTWLLNRGLPAIDVENKVVIENDDEVVEWVL